MDLTQGKVPSVLLRFALPFLLANVLQALYGGADLFVVGQFDDAASVAGVAIGSQVMQTVTGIITGLTTGTTVLIAIGTGARDKRQVALTIGTATWIFALMAVVLTTVMALGHTPLALLMQTPPEALRDTVIYALNERETFFTSTAAVKMHHAFMYGLLEHSLKMARMADKLLPLYPFVDADLAIAGCILHDIGKTVEYSQGLVTDRTREGILQGHVVLGYRIVRRAGIKNALPADILLRLEHIILSHQGEPEWGAAVRAATPEAVFVSTIDNFDAKMGALEAALDTAEGAEFVEVPALKVKLLADRPDYSAEEK